MPNSLHHKDSIKKQYSQKNSDFLHPRFFSDNKNNIETIKNNIF